MALKDDVKRELRGAGREAAAEASKALVSAFFAWVRTKPLRSFIARRRAERAKK